jgi:lipopolysaccharide transport system ATP-binding protein
MSTAIEFDHVGKQYRLGLVSTRTLSHDLNRWWHTAILKQEDPYLRIGEVNDRTIAANHSQYVWALRDIDFKVEQGDVVGIIGKNGAGKSTLLKLLSKVTGPTVGNIRARGRIGALLEVGTGFHGEMTGRENIYMNGAIIGMRKSEIDRKLDEIIDFSGCERYIDTPVKRYSSGMTVRLGFAVAAHLDPEILVVDEVLAVGDAEFQKKAIGKMQDVSKGEGRTVLFVSHNMASIRQLCRHGVLLNNGEVELMGEIDDVVSAYLASNAERIGDVSYVDNITSNGTKEIEILSLRRISPYKLDNNQDVVIHVKVRRNTRIQKFNLLILLCDPVNVNTAGVSFSDDIIWDDEMKEKEFEIKIPEHHLSKGKYVIDVITGSGNAFSSFSYYHAVYTTLTFEVEAAKGTIITEWHNYWGKSLYPMTITSL